MLMYHIMAVILVLLIINQSGSGHLDTKAITFNGNNRFGYNEDVILYLFSSVVV